MRDKHFESECMFMHRVFGTYKGIICMYILCIPGGAFIGIYRQCQVLVRYTYI